MRFLLIALLIFTGCSKIRDPQFSFLTVVEIKRGFGKGMTGVIKNWRRCETAAGVDTICYQVVNESYIINDVTEEELL